MLLDEEAARVCLNQYPGQGKQFQGCLDNIPTNADEAALLAYKNGTYCQNMYSRGSGAYKNCLHDVLDPTFKLRQAHIALVAAMLSTHLTNSDKIAWGLLGALGGTACAVSIVCAGAMTVINAIQQGPSIAVLRKEVFPVYGFIEAIHFAGWVSSRITWEVAIDAASDRISIGDAGGWPVADGACAHHNVTRRTSGPPSDATTIADKRSARPARSDAITIRNRGVAMDWIVAFVLPRPGQSWEDALAAEKRRLSSPPPASIVHGRAVPPLGADMRLAVDRVAARARALTSMAVVEDGWARAGITMTRDGLHIGVRQTCARGAGTRRSPTTAARRYGNSG